MGLKAQGLRLMVNTTDHLTRGDSVLMTTKHHPALHPQTHVECFAYNPDLSPESQNGLVIGEERATTGASLNPSKAEMLAYYLVLGLL